MEIPENFKQVEREKRLQGCTRAALLAPSVQTLIDTGHAFGLLACFELSDHFLQGPRLEPAAVCKF